MTIPPLPDDSGGADICPSCGREEADGARCDYCVELESRNLDLFDEYEEDDDD